MLQRILRIAGRHRAASTRRTPAAVDAAHLVWALGSLCALNRIPFDAELLLKQFPPPYTSDTLIHAARALGFRIQRKGSGAGSLASLAFPCLAALRKPGADPAAGEAITLALVSAASPDGVVLFEAGANTPQSLAPEAFAERYAGFVFLVARNPPVLKDPDGAAESTAFGFRWFVPELLKHRQVWRDVIAASPVIQLLALGTPLFTQTCPSSSSSSPSCSGTAGFRMRSIANTYNVAAGGQEQLMSLLILVVGAYTVMSGTEFTIGMLVAFQMFAGKLSQPMLRLAGLWQQFQQASLSETVLFSGTLYDNLLMANPRRWTARGTGRAAAGEDKPMSPVCSLRVGLLCALLSVVPATAFAMDMQLVGKQLILKGPVADSDYVQFKEMLRLNGAAIDTVVLGNSPGGDGWTGLAIGELIRDHGLRAVVAGACRSACAIIFLGGRVRHFADGNPGAQARLGFHGTYGKTDKSMQWGSLHKRTHWIVQQTAGKLDEELLKRWQGIENPRGMVYFFDPNSLRRADGVSVLYCDGTEDRKKDRFEQCEKIPGKDALNQGIVTSLEAISVEKPPRRAVVVQDQAGASASALSSQEGDN